MRNRHVFCGRKGGVTRTATGEFYPCRTTSEILGDAIERQRRKQEAQYTRRINRQANPVR